MQPQRFLIIDDDPINNLLCKRIIQQAFPGIDVVSYTVPEEGVEYIETEYVTKPANTILFLDINMPTLTGWDVLEEFERFPHLIKENFIVYILSSSVDPADKQMAANNHFVTGYIEKPLQRSMLQGFLALKTS